MTVPFQAIIILCVALCIHGHVHAMAPWQDSTAASAKEMPTQRPQRAPRAPRPPSPGTFTSLDSALGMPDSVVVLYLRGKSLTKLPKGVSKFVNLQSIDLGGCGLTAFPRELLSCKQLTSLNLSDNPIGSIPNDIDSLSNLNRLSLRNTGITTLPASIGKCLVLSQIELQGNPLASLPIAEINQLPRLRNFGIGGYVAAPSNPSSTQSADPTSQRTSEGGRKK